MPKGNPAGYLPKQKKKAPADGMRSFAPVPPKRYRK
jgi:hypothetical protein